MFFEPEKYKNAGFALSVRTENMLKIELLKNDGVARVFVKYNLKWPVIDTDFSSLMGTEYFCANWRLLII